MGFFSKKKKENKPVAPPAALKKTLPISQPETQKPLSDEKAKLMAQMLSMYMKEDDHSSR